MRSKLLFLMLTAGFLAGIAHANLLSNPGFEVEAPGTSAEDRVGNWYIQTYGAGTWNWEDGSSAEGAPRSGDKFLYLDGMDTYGWVWIEQDVPVTPGEEYFLSVWHKDGSRDDDPRNGSCDFGVEWYDSGDNLVGGDGRTVAQGGEAKTVDADWDIESIDEWSKYIFGVTTNSNSSDTGVGQQLIAPQDAAYARVALLHWWALWQPNYPWSRGLNIDDVYFGKGERPVHTPDPANNAEGVPPDPIPNTPAGTTTLSWKRDFFGGKAPQVEVYWGTADDPNFWIQTPTKIMNLADVNDLDLGDAIGGPIYLQPDDEYFWALKYEDPNDGNWGIAELAEGDIWSFDTINRPPEVDAGLHYERWQDDPCTPTPIKIGLDASYIDDGLPLGGNLTYTWTETLSGGATVPTYIPSRTVEDPNVIFTTAGGYILKLTIHDDFGGGQDKTGEDTTLIRIFANSDDRLRAHYQLDGNTTDIAEGHPATFVDDPAWGTGQVAGAVELDGTDDLLSDGLNDSVEISDTGSDPNFQPDTWENSDLIDGMTISAWMKLDEDGWSKSWETIVAKNNSSWELNRDAGNDNVRFVVQSGVGEAISSGVTDVESGWHQVVGVYDRNTIKIYVDGLEAGSGDANPLNLEANPHNTQDWQAPKAAGKVHIGACSNVTGDLAFAGLIDQVRIYDAAVPKWAEHTGTPGIVELYRADGGHVNCGGVYLAGDTNEDCYITLADFALVAKDWLECNDEANADCD